MALWLGESYAGGAPLDGGGGVSSTAPGRNDEVPHSGMSPDDVSAPVRVEAAAPAAGAGAAAGEEGAGAG